MDDKVKVKCKKCKGQPPRRGNGPCGTCGGSGFVTVTTDAEGNTVVKPAVR